MVADGCIHSLAHPHSVAVFEVNYFGVVAMTQKFLPLIRASKGRIINVSSILGLICRGGGGAYCSSKFALEGFSDSLRKEVRPLGVAVVLVNPATVLTKIFGSIRPAAENRIHILHRR